MAASKDELFRPGETCWRIADAARLSVIIDADGYFRAARAAMLKARRQILLIGWDFDARIPLGIDPDDGGPAEIGAFLTWLVRRTPGLKIHILRWDTGALKTLIRPLTLVRVMRWWWEKRIELRLDRHHPPAGSHHQKIVVVDDCIAFCGGIDMTRDRWDTREHLDEQPHRLEPDGTPYGPWHDATTAVSGAAAAALGDLCRDRWQRSGGGRLPDIPDIHNCWPDHLEPTLTDVPVAIARSQPDWGDDPPIREIEALYLDLIASAKRWVYAESQYFASRRIAEAIARRLAEPDGPEFVIVNPLKAQGWLEPIAMDSARARLVEALRPRDPYGRLRLYHPFTAGGQPIYVHAKVMAVDERVLRVGSSNFNNRSMRLDTECDIAFAAEADGDPVSQAVANIRNGLIAEHLGREPGEVADTLARTGSLIRTVEALRSTPGRTLVSYEVPDLDGVRKWLADNEVLDPEGPEEMFEAFSERGLLRRLPKRRRRVQPRR